MRSLPDPDLADAADPRDFGTREPEFDDRVAPAWQDQARCVAYAGQVDFFPARGESVRDAKAICAVCPVQTECLEFALRLKVAHGVWGGLSERERRGLRRDRHRTPV